jgi:hypothetical protein
LSLSFDGFWQGVMAYEPPMCVCCGQQVAVDEHGCCCRCHWKVRAEVERGWPAFSSYLGNWAAFSDWEMGS